MTSVTDGMRTPTNRSVWRALAFALTLALIASACSGSDDAVATEAAEAPVDDSTESGDDAMADEDHEGEDAMADDGAETGDDAMADDGADEDEGSAAPATGPPASLPPEEARAAAEQNIPMLQGSDDVRDIEVVSVYDGSITSLREVVTGDRPVLVWFWAPH